MDASTLSFYRCVEALRDARSAFYASVVASAEQHKQSVNATLTREEYSQLRLESVEQLAEFLFLMECFELNNNGRELRRYLENRNAKLRSQLNSLKGSLLAYTSAGLTASRLEQGVLDADQIEAMVAEADDLGLRYDQSSLGALLIEAMSLASSRNLIILLSDCGFLKRKGSGAKNIRSTGTLEQIYREKISLILERVVAKHSEKANPS